MGIKFPFTHQPFDGLINTEYLCCTLRVKGTQWPRTAPHRHLPWRSSPNPPGDAALPDLGAGDTGMPGLREFIRLYLVMCKLFCMYGLLQ